MRFFYEVTNNKVIIACFFGWLIAQTLKVIITLIQQKTLDLTRFWGSGGMPSSHSSFVTSLATSVGLIDGFSSSSFALSAVLALVVMYDAAGVRRAVGIQAGILNTLVEDLKTEKANPFTNKQLKELIGHTPIEVFFGGLLGILIANIVVFYVA